MSVRIDETGTVWVNDLRVDPVLFQRGYRQKRSPHLCIGSCCVDGVWLDITDRDRILAAKELVIRTMDDTQPKVPNAWFEPEQEDSDFPSGRCSGTNTKPPGCVFRMGDGRCVLQVAAVKEGLEPYTIKPFYCVLFPIVITEGELTFDDFCSPANECCTIYEQFDESVIDACRIELVHAIGLKDYESLRSIAHTFEQRGE